MAMKSSGGALAGHRALLLDAVRAAGQVSRAGLARQTGLNAATVTVVIRELIIDGLITESGRAASTGGKPAVLLSLAVESRFAVGVHLDHTATTYVLVDLSGRVVARWARRGGTDAHAPQHVVQRIATDITVLLQRTGLAGERLTGIGLVCPGPATTATGIALSTPAMQPWIDFPLVEALADATGLPVVLGNDATAAAIGEYWAAALDPRSVFAAIYLGVGIGSGILVAGHPLVGASGNAGEIGHICVVRDGALCWCGSHGCLETVAGAVAIVTAARNAGCELSGTLIDEQFAAAARSALAGHRGAAAVFAQAARDVAVAVHTLTTILDLDQVILTGPGFAVAGPLFLPAIRQCLEQTFFARGAHRVQVSISVNATAAAATGAAAMVLQSELAPQPSPSGPSLIVSDPDRGISAATRAGPGTAQ